MIVAIYLQYHKFRMKLTQGDTELENLRAQSENIAPDHDTEVLILVNKLLMRKLWSHKQVRIKLTIKSCCNIKMSNYKNFLLKNETSFQKGSSVSNKDSFWRSWSAGSCKLLHFVVSVTDDGEPKLTRYQRVIITVEP